jgi:hypothetical protein
MWKQCQQYAELENWTSTSRTNHLWCPWFVTWSVHPSAHCLPEWEGRESVQCFRLHYFLLHYCDTAEERCVNLDHLIAVEHFHASGEAFQLFVELSITKGNSDSSNPTIFSIVLHIMCWMRWTLRDLLKKWSCLSNVHLPSASSTSEGAAHSALAAVRQKQQKSRCLICRFFFW